MEVYGVDFTSRPRAAKPITRLRCRLEGGVLRAQGLDELTDFDAFEAMLDKPGPWIAGLDFPFGLPRKFIERIRWPGSWAGYVEHAARLGKAGFRAALEDYRRNRPPGDKEHRRTTDIAAGSISPQKLYGTPVALMFFEGAPRLVRAGVTIPHMQDGDPDRIVVEAYPGALARKLIGRSSYKNDMRARQTPAQHEARRKLLEELTAGARRDDLGFAVVADQDLCDDPGGDALDALLCAVQAAWAWNHRAESYGAPEHVDPLEGWIVDPPATCRPRM
ncbi:DUF429 domain-containing protein [Dichotomicrobium thermohalophilum]|uniref:Uncharacterized protein DUF429 n=1 Tax=Dichotomicrobium thermohalophilum TaxID=933063 RepID=A0A397Q485_9HYPH|nr:DUF429 domain-containing protein [Dichotomicrobium thermohalophilum]RIA55743.1 uncharacterized protein DUF429 [Dichotomicrobium thermohalophilum]